MNSETNQQHKGAFLEFLDHGDYMHHVESMLKQNQTRLLLSLDELRSFDAELTVRTAALSLGRTLRHGHWALPPGRRSPPPLC